MHARKIVARILGPCVAGLHAKRAQALMRAVSAELSGGALSLSALALGMPSSTALRHRVKSMDRLLGNAGLQAARAEFYGTVAQRQPGSSTLHRRFLKRVAQLWLLAASPRLDHSENAGKPQSLTPFSRSSEPVPYLPPYRRQIIGKKRRPA